MRRGSFRCIRAMMRCRIVCRTDPTVGIEVGERWRLVQWRLRMRRKVALRSSQDIGLSGVACLEVIGRGMEGRRGRLSGEVSRRRVSTVQGRSGTGQRMSRGDRCTYRAACPGWGPDETKSPWFWNDGCIGVLSSGVSCYMVVSRCLPGMLATHLVAVIAGIRPLRQISVGRTSQRIAEIEIQLARGLCSSRTRLHRGGMVDGWLIRGHGR